MAYSGWLGFAAVWLLGLITGLLIAWGVFPQSNSSQSGSQKVNDVDAGCYAHGSAWACLARTRDRVPCPRRAVGMAPGGTH